MMPSFSFQALKMCSLLKYEIGIMPMVSFVFLGFALGTKKKPLALSKFMFNLNAFIIYRTSYSDISFSFLVWYFGRSGNHDLNSSKDDDTRKNATKIC